MGHSVPFDWSDVSVSGLLASTSEGQNSIILLLATTKVSILLLISILNPTKLQRNKLQQFWEVVTERLISNLPPLSVLVVCNYPYHNVQIDPASRRSDMIYFLHEETIQRTKDLRRPELHGLVNHHRPVYRTSKIGFWLNMAIQSCGHHRITQNSVQSS